MTRDRRQASVRARGEMLFGERGPEHLGRGSARDIGQRVSLPQRHRPVEAGDGRPPVRRINPMFTLLPEYWYFTK